jgi:hypothetical protein
LSLRLAISINTLCKDVKSDKHYSKLSVVDAHSTVC